MVGDTDPRSLEERTSEILEAISGTKHTTERPPSNTARHLCVRVLENGRQKVNIQLPATVVESLTDILPDGLEPKLVARGISVQAIADEALAGGLAPGQLFRLEDGPKDITVWLE